MDILSYLKNNILVLDGGMGTLLQAKGLKVGEHPERWNFTHAEEIINIHKEYFDSGSNVVSTNTFGANALKFSEQELESIVKCAVENAKIARSRSKSQIEKFIALDIGPTGKMLKPYGELDFETAVEIFSKTVKLGVKYGVDLVVIETMNDSYETKAAVLAVKENSNLPVFVTNAYGKDGKLMMGSSPRSMIAMLEGLGVDAIGVNCSYGPKTLMPVISEYLKYSSLPIIFKPNAGLPTVKNGKTTFDLPATDFAVEVYNAVKKGVRVVGGCCGTTPNYIKELSAKIQGVKPKKITKKNYTVVSSYTHAVDFESAPILIGERINPTGKKLFKDALRNNDIDYILKEGIVQQEKGVHILDVNVGLPEIDETKMLKTVTTELQAVVNLPLQIDTSNFTAMEGALRVYNGKPMINSVNGKKESMDSVFPLVKKYGGVVVCLTLDENGIPKKAEYRLKIAKKIIKRAKEYGICKNDLIFDPLTLAISADKTAGVETLKAVKLITEKLKSKTILGVSNVSFGLPDRDSINSQFFTLALGSGLTSAIMNPNSNEMLKVYYTYKAVNGKDENCLNYINFISNLPKKEEVSSVVPKKTESKGDSELQNAIIKGQKGLATSITKNLLKSKAPLDIVNEDIIPALNIVGVGFENKTVYLPELLMSAESAKSAFTEIKNLSKKSAVEKGVIVIATVKGDIHDIGKNIVKLLLENYGFRVVDLGKDVEPKEIVETAIKLNAKLVGLSALMTTTVPAMEQTIKLLNSKAPTINIMVGGAVLTQAYADKIGANYYCKDGMEAVRCAEELFCK